MPATSPGGLPNAAAASLEIVVPARNESHRLPEGLAALCRKAAALPFPAAILVVDSASTDNTAEVVRNWPAGPVPVRLLQCETPGKGRAVRAGLLATSAPFVGFCDADMATDLTALDVVISLLAAGRGVVVGSRGLDCSVVEDRRNPARRLGAAVFRLLARQIVRGASDTQCGFKFFAGPLARAAALSLTTAGFAFDVELLAICQQLGATVTEIPVVWRDMPGSTFSASRHSASVFRELAVIWLRRRPGAAGAEWPKPIRVRRTARSPSRTVRPLPRLRQRRRDRAHVAPLRPKRPADHHRQPSSARVSRSSSCQ